VVWGENRPEWLVCYWGLPALGAVVVPIDYRSSPSFAAKVRHVVDARVVVVGDEVPAFGDAFDDAAVWPLSAASIGTRCATSRRHGVARRPDQIIFTSGATAEPKGRRDSSPQRPRQRGPVEREVVKYKKYAAPVPSAALRQPAAAQPHVRQSMATNIPPMVRGTVIFTRSFNPHDIIG
jgi:long-chain acyl-CoA synthetase